MSHNQKPTNGLLASLESRLDPETRAKLEKIGQLRANAMKAEPDYKLLYEEAMQHLKNVSSTRNAFDPRIMAIIEDDGGGGFRFRDPQIDALHMDAVNFLRRERIFGRFDTVTDVITKRPD